MATYESNVFFIYLYMFVCMYVCSFVFSKCCDWIFDNVSVNSFCMPLAIIRDNIG